MDKSVEEVQEAISIIEEATKEDCTLEVDSGHAMERLEETRRFLNALLKPPVLQALLDLKKVLDLPGPEQYSYFVSETGDRDCKYALLAIDAFKTHRLDTVKRLLKEASSRIDEI